MTSVAELHKDKETAKPLKVLVIRFSSIGDMVLTTPVVRCLKKQRPDTEIHYCTKKQFATIVESNPYIDKCVYLHDDINVLIAELKKENYDYVVDLHNNLRTLRIKRALEAPSASFPKLNVQKWLLVNLKWNLMPDKSIVDRYLETVKPLGIKNDGQGLDYFIPEQDQVTQQDIPVSHWMGYIGLVIGAQHATKKLPVEKLKELCRSLEYPIILMGGKEDAAVAEEIRAVDDVKIYNACGKFSLNESADLVRRAKLIISHDTGLMHIAAAFKKEIISVWGNTVPELGMYPYMGYNNLHGTVAPNVHLMEVKGLSCRPCSKIGYQNCPKRHFRCMNNQDIPAIATLAKKSCNKPTFR